VKAVVASSPRPRTHRQQTAIFREHVDGKFGQPVFILAEHFAMRLMVKTWPIAAMDQVA